MMDESIYFAPFSYIPYGSKIVIYGGGKLGENYYRKIKLSGRATVSAIVDAQAKHLLKIFKDTPLYEPDKIRELQFDYILIAVEDSGDAEDIKKNLSTLDVSDSKIIWNDRKSDMSKVSSHEIIKCFERNIENKNRRFFLFMIPEHGNLGDYAIGYAEFAFFEQYFPQYNVYGITTTEWLDAHEFYLNLIKPDDIVFINGGGFFGDLRGDADIYMHIVESFPQNIKIFFPNTLTYKEKLCKSNKAFIKDIEWFRKQENLFIFWRESPSYNLFNQYEKRSYLFLDMVFFSHYERNDFNKKDKVLLCLRDDCEKIFNKKNELENTLEKAGIEFDVYDINVKKYVSQQAGKTLLQYTIQLFQSYDCIITDRLHGMILAAVSNVPCIAFDNYTHKISGVFEYIRNLQYIKLIKETEINHIVQTISLVCDAKIKCGQYKSPMTEFEKMADTISEIIGGTGERDYEKYS